MFKSSPAPWQLALLGHQRHQQIILATTLTSMALYAVSLLMQWVCVWLGNASFGSAALLTGVTVVVQTLVYTALRSGWSQRFSDPALTMMQMLLALLTLSAAYLINPNIRAVLLMLGTVVLVFGALTLSPRHCKLLGWLALAIFGTAMMLGALMWPQAFPLSTELSHFAFTAAALPLTGHLAARLSGMRQALRQQKAELRAALDRVNLLATRDELTDLPNRRSMQDLMARDSPRLRRSDAPMCIAVLDLDHFKAVNDRFGHGVGDKVLQTFAAESITVLREADTLARWGGEEFLLMLPDTPPVLALMVIQRLHEHMRNPATWASCGDARVTFSAGLAVHDPSEAFDQTLDRADRALYEAKRSGRDRCVEAQPASAPTHPIQLTLLAQDA